ncbi:lysophospholipid acyltransferase family protein [Actinoplanes sp. NPDC049265]|uniref:lysophospholipid acyltransferase family protein n=1 Tax=Actinoplanes sp. NPDC049265 TaxID=3363902 RepID=UPI003710C9D4
MSDGLWRAPWLWRLLLRFARVLLFPLCRLRVSGRVPGGGPVILAVNHVSPVDPVVMMAACARVGVVPRFMATGGVFRAPVLGSVMRACGQIRVDRRTARVAEALPAAVAALREGSAVLVYPEGRIGLDPWMWPERGKTGAARMAALSGAPVVPVAQWGTHAVMAYVAPRRLLRSLAYAVWHRPVVRVGFGAAIDVSRDDPRVATRLIVEGIDAVLTPLRAGEMRVPRFVDRTRPVDLSRVRQRRTAR